MKKNSLLLFALLPVIPLLLVLFGFLKSNWGWTLMNDYYFLTTGTGFWGKVCAFWSSFMGCGQLRWTFLLRYGFMYTAFAHAPKLFFIYQWFEVVTMLGIWGMLAYRLTRKKIAFWLMPAVALTSRPFYDAFFVPSLGDNSAMLIFGLGLLVLVYAESLVAGHSPRSSGVRLQQWTWVLVLFFFALGAMEFTLAGFMAIGFALIWLYKIRRDHFPVAGVLLVAAGLLYGIFLKVVIVHGYSSAYRLTDFHRMFLNFLGWGKEIFRIHLLWIILGGAILFKSWGSSFWSRYLLEEKFGIVLGVLMYALWFAALLPWCAVGYHSLPLLVVFSFLTAVLLASPLEDLDEKWFGCIAVGVLTLSLLVSQQTIYTARVYNADIQRLFYFMERNTTFQAAARNQKVYCNQQEPSNYLSQWVNGQDGQNFKKFTFEPDVLKAAQEGAQFYVFLTWGEPLGTYLTAPGWEPFFVGEFCKVYKKQEKSL